MDKRPVGMLDAEKKALLLIFRVAVKGRFMQGFESAPLLLLRASFVPRAQTVSEVRLKTVPE